MCASPDRRHGQLEMPTRALPMLLYTDPNSPPSDCSSFHPSGGSTVPQLLQESGRDPARGWPGRQPESWEKTKLINGKKKVLNCHV